jgi:hypothetical protein
MRSELSEFSYGYAVVEAFARRWRPKLLAAPVLPSLISEGSPDGGYDVLLQRPGILMFLQFKVSERLTRSNAREARLNILTTPYFRFRLMSGASPQHDLLLSLDNGTNVVRYVAPLFHRLTELDAAYHQDEVLQNSILFRPQRIGAFTDNDQHAVVFESRAIWTVASDPRTYRGDSDEEAIKTEVHSAIREHGRTALREERLTALRSEIVMKLNSHLALTQRDGTLFPLESSARVRSPLADIAYLSRTYLATETLIVAAGQ